MKIALFGGTFDPIHTGHVQAARAAARRLRLDKILLIPTGKPPHKHGNRLTPFPHRYGMTVLACAGDRRLIPSLLEAPTADDKPFYSIDTVRKVRSSLHINDRLFFLIGVDAFLELPHWKEYHRLLDLVDFIVVSRPGFDADKIRKVVAAEMTRPGAALQHPSVPSSMGRGLTDDAGRLDTIRLRHSTLYVLRGVHMHVASHAIRKAIGSGGSVTGLVPQLVEEYIRKEGLYGPHRLASEVRAQGHAPLSRGRGGKQPG